VPGVLVAGAGPLCRSSAAPIAPPRGGSGGSVDRHFPWTRAAPASLYKRCALPHAASRPGLIGEEEQAQGRWRSARADPWRLA
jgi:hypothetical protein